MASLTAGTTFTDGVANDVTAAKLGALVTNATPTSGLIQDRTAETVVGVNDTLLIGDASDSNNLKRMTVANLLKAPLVSTSGTVDSLTTGTTTSTAQIVTSGTIATLNSTAATITTLTAGTTTSTAATITTGTIPTLVATTLVTTGTGTAASPAIVPTGDTNTGIFFPAADTIAFAEGGTEGMRIDSNGNVGIGGTTNLLSKLTVVNASTSTANTVELRGNRNFAAATYGANAILAISDQTRGTHDFGAIRFEQNPDTADGGGALVRMFAGGASSSFPANAEFLRCTAINLAGGADNIQFRTAGTERLRIEASGKIDASGEVEAKNVTVNVNTLATATGTQNLDFTSEGYLTHAITGNITYTASNYSAGRSLSVRITCDGTARNLTFPTNWVFVGAKPTSIAASKVAVLSVTSFGTTEANAVAAYAVQT
jgi:hypothetical protein